jgi:hypothetical protein
MSPWTIFCFAGVLLTPAIIGGLFLLLPRHKSLPACSVSKIAGDTCLLYLLLWLASLSILVYIIFAFGKR